MSFNKNYKNYFGVAMYSKYPMITKGFIELDTSVRNSNNFCIFADIVKDKDTFRIYNTHFQSLKFQEDEYALFGQKEYTGNIESGVMSMLRKINKGYQKRADQANNVIKHMEQSPYPVIICGDFNDTPMSYVYNQFYSKFTDAFRNSSSGIGITYAGKVPAGRIDYVFHDQRLNSANFKIDERIYSDHKAISCEIWKK
jgi:endonuclease/exonuclease/phosphatase family metal-dependent hydrolase